MIPAFPLHWPDNIPRTKQRVTSKFKTGLSTALKNVRSSISLFAADSGRKVENTTISSNVTLGVDKPEDPGVAVWFTWDGMSVCIAVDRYQKVEDNLQAIHHIIEGRRTELRHGGLHIVRATFTGFMALPSPGGRTRTWRDVLGFPPSSKPAHAEVDARYRALAKKHHPDAGGSAEAMAELNTARDEALREIGA